MSKSNSATTNKTVFVQGNGACVEGALYAGCSFFAGYPITPSTEIAEIMSERLPLQGDRFIQMEDEIASICALIGASLAGKKAMTSTSGPGVSLMQEALGFAMITETPCVIVNVQRGGPSTGLPTMVHQGDVNQARWGTHGDHSVIALTASNHQDVFAMTVAAFNLAEKYRTPVYLMLDEVIGHMREKLVIPETGQMEVVDRVRTAVSTDRIYHPYLQRSDGVLPMSDFGSGHCFHVTGLFHNMWGFPTTDSRTVTESLKHLVGKIEDHSDEIAMYKEYYIDDADILFISYGASARSALELTNKMRSEGRRVGLLELQTLWPFPAAAVKNAAATARRVVVVEMNMGQLYREVEYVVGDHDKVYLANRIDGMLVTIADIVEVINIIEGRGL